MKDDITRDTFKKEKHYSSVRMQQGRVQLDADWNEQLDITSHRIETETIDSIGDTGAPLNNAGFGIISLGTDLLIGAGRYYVNGILCENEIEKISILSQPDIPNNDKNKGFVFLNGTRASFPPEQGTYLIYLDVWHRHVTALEDSDIREKALNGPDTATRLKAVWQVKLMKTDTNVNCLSNIESWNNLITAPHGELSARAESEEDSKDPCIITPGAGYRRLENQLYRVEIHKSGIQGKATFKWSRDNGSIAVSWMDGVNLTVSSLGRDKYLGFSSGQWIELFDDSNELYNTPGLLVKIVKTADNVIEIDPVGQTIDKNNFPDNPRIRRWDSVKDEPVSANTWIKLEDGVEIKFSDGNYKTGDYWFIPARTATADVEWEKDPSNNPLSLLPKGVRHDFCRLAIALYNGTNWTIISDCRKLFPPSTELVNLFYVSGDGQEAWPNTLLNEKLAVRVSNGGIPVLGAKVKFTVSGGGKIENTIAPMISVTDNFLINTDGKGAAECKWTLGQKGIQSVEAVLLDSAGNPVPGQKIIFNASISIAKNIFYEPGCEYLKEHLKDKTVQDAIDALCMREQTDGGCCETKLGENKDLNEVIIELIKKGKTDICICVPPGDYTLSKGLSIAAKTLNLSIKGCGRGSRLIVSKMEFDALNSFILQDVDIQTLKDTKDISIEFRDCNWVTIKDCYITSLGVNDVISIANAKQLVLSNNIITCSGSAIDIMDPYADILIENNRIMGTVSLYGKYEKEIDFGEEVKMLIKKQLNFGKTEGRLIMQNNQLTRLVFSNEIFYQIKEQINQGVVTIKSVFGKSYFHGNSFDCSNNYYVSKYLSLNSNDFGIAREDFMKNISIGETSIFVGNHAPDDTTMYNKSQKRKEAANTLLIWPNIP